MSGPKKRGVLEGCPHVAVDIKRACGLRVTSLQRRPAHKEWLEHRRPHPCYSGENAARWFYGLGDSGRNGNGVSCDT